MAQLIFVSVLLCISLTAVHADALSECKKADSIHKEFRYADEEKLLLAALETAKTPKEKTEVYWRLARVTLLLGDDAEDAGMAKEELLKVYERGEKFADSAIESFPNNPLSYYWKASNIGRWGQVKGIFDSLAKAEPMQKLLIEAIGIDSEHADSYFVLGELYDELPGWPISFGNIDWAVSFARKSIAINENEMEFGKVEKQYGYHIKLAKHLWKRNWNAMKRNAEQKGKLTSHNAKTSILEKNAFFEGTLTLGNTTDRDEAKSVIDMVIGEIESFAAPNKGQKDDLKDAREVVKAWK